MKKLYLLTCCLVFTMLNARAEWNITFCTETDTTGKCINPQKELKWQGEKLDAYVMITNTDTLGTTKLLIKVYEMANDKAGEVYAELTQFTKPHWKFASKKIYFVKAGYYKVDIYNQSNQLLVTDYVTVMDR